ncbi:ester cyclase [Pseudooceanicola sediminis]|uniref:Ester cyclase n=1 Tax=Pseudooceanicola sediminis TaxID=2211117 RepID=A0A399IYV7_9RHOB|nr:ester cyclase [Pseudooceanicola sediminis]KAA2312963.1 ester cyclase [Puniceibacterium sp. HSS470]RII37637.1 ester cyclase [Pseudooceanicola sediminis]|tara:strand:+ start:7595 stop:7981 length:387 start_codon:yes stop_codon:yes gene_type:complete
MTPETLSQFYLGYIDCLNTQDWARLGLYVHGAVEHNDRPLGLDGYRQMLENDFRAIPDLTFNIAKLASQPPCIAARLAFDCTPVGTLFDLPVDGRRVQFSENVFYEVAEGRIRWVWSVIDTAAIAAQL